MPSDSRLRISVTLALVVLAGSVSGCKQIKEKAERVFLRQNQVASALMDVILTAELEDPELAARLYGEETELNDACAPLQKAGSRAIYDEEVDGPMKMRAFRSLDPCEGEVSELAELLWEVDPEIATLHLGAREAEGAMTVAAGAAAGAASVVGATAVTPAEPAAQARQSPVKPLAALRADARRNHWYSQGGR